MVAHNPLNGSGRTDFPHPALASGDNAEATQRIWVMDLRSGQPVVSNAPHPVPQHPAVLAAPRQRAMPGANHMEAEHAERRIVHRDTVVAIVSRDHRVQPITHLRDGVVHAPLAVVAPRLAVHPRRGFPLEREIGRAQGCQVVDVVQERSELHPPISGCRQTYPLQRTKRAFPALGPGRVLPGRIPFGRSSSLHLLRRRWPSIVRRLQRYDGTVRLPVFVHRRRVSLDFPTRPVPPSGAGEHRISRFSCEVFPYVHGVSDHAGPERISRWRCVRCCLPLLLTTSASRRNVLSRLYTRPARTTVNASTLLLREAPHDSGPSWVAGPSTCDSFIHNTSPVYPGAQGENRWPHHPRTFP